ncbi:Na/Pi-cotransporter II-related protein [Neisseria zoodegmatis]|uniref:Na/Pi-cotransporter II-related protein n=1 Tax=Neisseria zoodegmatis TaxID=326523 RepID=A0A378WTU8_9NEIS|nr:Na/Pi symporter [Neisseria zoodegmatis]SUA44638.1 Na/Pi-cotransporter II-related protein [Neisseria zoodegmatis]
MNISSIKTNKNVQNLWMPVLIALVVFVLGYSFWYSGPWLKLCYGLALFLFGMQCIEEGLRNAAGGTLEKLMAKSTSTPAKGLGFGVGATFILQSSTLVSLLTIAFLSTGLITLAGGIAVILGTNLGATSGIWLLALAGQSISLSPVAVPMLVFGILAGFLNAKTKTIGRVLVGIALIFLGIDAIKDGFHALGGQVDLSTIKAGGLTEIAVFSAIGLLLTIVLQSSHATLILTLAALSAGQISVEQGFAIAIGSNVGSSASTAFVGMLGSDRSGQRLALAHLLFNSVTAVLSLLLWLPLTKLVTLLAGSTGMSSLLQLALFHTLFNGLGLAVFWKLQNRLAGQLMKWLPEKTEGTHFLPEDNRTPVRALYLSPNMLRSGDTALRAVFKEIGHLNAVSLEVICHALFVPVSKLYEEGWDTEQDLPIPLPPLHLDAQAYYESQIKPLYSELLDFTSKIDIEGDDQNQELTTAHMAAFQMVEIVKESKHLQKNLQRYLQEPDSAAARDYIRLRKHLFKTLVLFRQITALPVHSEKWQEQVALLSKHVDSLETFRGRALVKLRNKQISGWETSSLMNDINYARRIGWGVQEIINMSNLDFSHKATVKAAA